MKIFNIKKEKNGKTSQKTKIKGKLVSIPAIIPQKSAKTGVRRISSGLFQYDGIYTLYRIPKRRN